MPPKAADALTALGTVSSESTVLGRLRAASGQEGVGMTLSQNPDLILLDLMMPGMTGFDLVEALGADLIL
jgi:CheY-like chemotaxis protein